MTYQVLARKWRPRTFLDMVSQDHVLQALINSLDNNRLHHAYLFTGTRGVGKTTVARIFAKSLNCEHGINSKPCNKCSICRDIDHGAMIDLIEVDAASRTKVEDTRELLENVQYMPSRARFKVYLIDEVHMLSTHSFNALLKTLEEPPSHVMFLFATTDPHKLPETVLSRCLHFSLKNISEEKIILKLKSILDVENIQYDIESLVLLSKYAKGSMRDALSLTDQAIALTNSNLIKDKVEKMLGTLNQDVVYDLVEYIILGMTAELFTMLSDIAEQEPDWNTLVDEVLNCFHKIALVQMLASSADNKEILRLSKMISKEDTQYYYQVALAGKKDFILAPDLKSGFEMLLLRMIAFKPNSELIKPDTEKNKVDLQKKNKSIKTINKNSLSDLSEKKKK